jgi:hypothetical protein
MRITIKMLVIAIAVASLALAPSLIVINSADATTHYCRDYRGMSLNWINGCQQGWWDHNHCYPYSPDGESNDFYYGYKVGWKKGSCK